MIIDKGRPLYGVYEGEPCPFGHTVRFMSTERCGVCYRFGVTEKYVRPGDKRFKSFVNPRAGNDLSGKANISINTLFSKALKVSQI